MERQSPLLIAQKWGRRERGWGGALASQPSVLVGENMVLCRAGDSAHMGGGLEEGKRGRPLGFREDVIW